MSRAKDILNAIRIGLRQGVIKSPDIEFLYSDGPKRVSMLQLVGDAIAELEAQPKRRDREADRQRFTDPAFNRWLDDGISDSGHTVWDQIGSVVDAWAGWENREHYTADGHALGVDVDRGGER